MFISHSQLMAITILICLFELELHCLIKVLSSPFDFMRMPQTSFDCRLRAPGYYADMEANCKVSKGGGQKQFGENVGYFDTSLTPSVN